MEVQMMAEMHGDDDDVDDGDCEWVKCDSLEVILDFLAVIILQNFHYDPLLILNPRAYDDDASCLPF